MTIRLTMRILLLVAITALVVGACLIAFAALPEPESSFGWTAYAPLSNTVYSPAGAHVLSTAEMVGFGLMAAGLIGLAFWGGCAVGREHPRADSTPAPRPTKID